MFGRSFRLRAMERHVFDPREDREPQFALDAHHGVGALRRAADAQAGIAAAEHALGDRVGELVEGRVADALEPAVSMSGNASASPVTGRWPARKSRSAASFITRILAAIRVGSSLVPER